LGNCPEDYTRISCKKNNRRTKSLYCQNLKKNQMTKFRSYLKKIQNCMTNTVISVFQYIVCFPFLCSNIQAAPVYGVYISQLVRYQRACHNYIDFLDTAKLLTQKLFIQGFVKQSSAETTGNLSSAYGHFDNLCLISANKIEIFGRPIIKRC
jgi:hypothetical protein